MQHHKKVLEELFDYSLVIIHISRNFTSIAGGLAETSSIINSGTILLLYVCAMLVDAVAAQLAAIPMYISSANKK